MEYAEIIEALEREWSKPEGFFGRLREGSFDVAGFERVERILSGLEPAPENFPRRLVSLTWFAPLFMTWQRERIAAAGGNIGDLDAAVTRVENALERVLGVP